MKKTIQLAQQYPNLQTHLIQGFGEEWVVYASDEFTQEEAYEYVHRRKKTLQTFKEILQKQDIDARISLYAQYMELKESYAKQEVENRDKPCLIRTVPKTIEIENLSLYIRYGSPVIEMILNNEEYCNVYSDEEIETLFQQAIHGKPQNTYFEGNQTTLFLNNHYCSNTNCHYTTGITTENEQEADAKLISDGGFNKNKSSSCPQCKQDSLVFLPKK